MVQKTVTVRADIGCDNDGCVDNGNGVRNLYSYLRLYSGSPKVVP